MRFSAAYLTIIILGLLSTTSSVPVLGVSVPIYLVLGHLYSYVDNQAAGGHTFSIPTYSNFRKPGQETSPNEQAGNTVTNLSAQGPSPNEQSVNPVSNPFAQRPSPNEQTGNPVLVSPSTQGPSHKKQTVSTSARPVGVSQKQQYRSNQHTSKQRYAPYGRPREKSQSTDTQGGELPRSRSRPTKEAESQTSENEKSFRDSVTTYAVKLLMEDIHQHPGEKIKAGFYPPDGIPHPLGPHPTANEDPRILVRDLCIQQTLGTFDFEDLLEFDEQSTHNLDSYPDPFQFWLVTPEHVYRGIMSKTREQPGGYVIARLGLVRLPVYVEILQRFCQSQPDIRIDWDEEGREKYG
ncbi:hypothetical protein F5880DRAFT_1327718 [Lentinula raphanica]|nr:hypothetical protein F5880DRAFT_1327718 [Lentinula raphanica]